MTEQLTLKNFTKATGFRFRINREQKEAIKNGTLTREQAFQNFLADGGLERLQGRPESMPDSVYLDPDLTLENFSSKVEAITGTPRRFRVSQKQFARIKAGELTREEALAETMVAKCATNPPAELIGTETTGN